MTTLYWETCSNGDCPAKAVEGGKEHNGSTVYVARGDMGGELTVGKMVREAGGAFLPWGGKENSAFTYEVLVNPDGQQLCWVGGEMGSVPNGAVVGGRSASGEAQYVGRGDSGGVWVPGKMIESHGGVLFPYGGKENGATSYEVLCVRSVTPGKQ